jgi:Protein prenyltransferase alpha subunit repeat
MDVAETDSKNLSQARTQEMHFLDSILTSPLHRQSKSPTLWFHRWWLVNQLLPLTQEYKALFMSEIQIVIKSAERHANNYYAWQHARRLVSAMLKLKNPDQPLPVSQKEYDLIKTWCLSNPSDISGWTFLGFILRNVPIDHANASSLIQSVMDFAANTGWKKEALWVFLRDVACNESILSPEQRRRLYTQIDDFVEISKGQLTSAKSIQIYPVQRQKLWKLPVI